MFKLSNEFFVAAIVSSLILSACSQGDKNVSSTDTMPVQSKHVVAMPAVPSGTLCDYSRQLVEYDKLFKSKKGRGPKLASLENYNEIKARAKSDAQLSAIVPLENVDLDDGLTLGAFNNPIFLGKLGSNYATFYISVTYKTQDGAGTYRSPVGSFLLHVDANNNCVELPQFVKEKEFDKLKDMKIDPKWGLYLPGQ
ncbi:MAG: hypothetical protein JWM56_603 [Candidatus Peribacteria bacterium]|nr:hypothetical protein [Candidatus Peribacteria bacterium]